MNAGRICCFMEEPFVAPLHWMLVFFELVLACGLRVATSRSLAVSKNSHG